MYWSVGRCRRTTLIDIAIRARRQALSHIANPTHLASLDSGEDTKQFYAATTLDASAGFKQLSVADMARTGNLAETSVPCEFEAISKCPPNC